MNTGSAGDPGALRAATRLGVATGAGVPRLACARLDSPTSRYSRFIAELGRRAEQVVQAAAGIVRLGSGSCGAAGSDGRVCAGGAGQVAAAVHTARLARCSGWPATFAPTAEPRGPAAGREPWHTVGRLHQEHAGRNPHRCGGCVGQLMIEAPGLVLALSDLDSSYSPQFS